MPTAPDHLQRVDEAATLLGSLAERDVLLGPMTTYRVGGPADLFVRITARDQLDRVASAIRATGLSPLVFGRGSNLLVADAGFRGIAISVAAICDGIDIDVEASRVRAGSAVLLPVLARRTAAAGLTGFEWAVGVPGSVGGAVKMNAGGHGSDMAASLVEVTIADLSSADVAVRTVAASDVGLRFRGSALRATDVVLDATLQLGPGDKATAEAELSDIVQWRRSNQPGGQNAGSVFVNPVPGEVTCGELIDRAGLRGFRHGSAMVSEKHANFIQADEDGSADDVRTLMRIVRDRVEADSGWCLRSEIRLVGFDDE